MATRAANLRARRAAPARTVKVAASNDVAAKLAGLGCDPIAIMARLAMDESLDPKLRAAMAKELAELASVQATAHDESAPPLGEVIAAAWRKPPTKKSGAR